MIKRMVIGVVKLLAVAMILAGFVAYLCVAESENMLLTSAVFMIGMFGGGLVFHIADCAEKRAGIFARRRNYYGSI